MKTLNCLTSACRCCRYYKPEGRRGGVCQQLGAPVRGSWKACSLALPPFAPSWEALEGMMILSDEHLIVQEALVLDCSLDYTKADLPEVHSAPTPATLTARGSATVAVL
jgi:hypothetical protein